MADEKYFYHVAKTPLFALFLCQRIALALIAAAFFVHGFRHFFLDCHIFSYVFFFKSGKMSGKLFHFTTCLLLAHYAPQLRAKP